MTKLIIVLILSLLSLLTIFRAPTNLLWYISILVTEFSAIFICVLILLFFWHTGSHRDHVLSNILSIAAILLYAIPWFTSYNISRHLDEDIDRAFGDDRVPVDVTTRPVNFGALLKNINRKEKAHQTFTFTTNDNNQLQLDFYKCEEEGYKPCVVVVHGGSWAGGNSRQLPELNSYLAKHGFHVAAINYRLAPSNHYPAQMEDLQHAWNYLRDNSRLLSIDTNNFVLLGRSAGGQIALLGAYALKLAGLKGVISYYGPADMVWGYAHPANRLVFNSCKIMEDYLGGTYNQLPEKYKNSSPIEAVSSSAVPTLLIHGKNDPLVAYEHSTRLAARLSQLGVKHYLLSLPWATHGLDYTLGGPGGQLSTYTVHRFLQIVTHD